MNADNRAPENPNSPSAADQPQAADDPRVLAAVQEYLAALESGDKPNRKEFLSRHPQIAEELSACLDGLAFVHSAAAQARAPASTAQEDDLTGAQPLGDFRLLREIGRGGMGVVYEAVQLSVGRKKQGLQCR